MRPFLALIAGGPGRVSVTAAALVCIGFVLAGHAIDLAAAAYVTVLWFALFVLSFAVLSIVATSTGVADDAKPTPATSEEAE